MELADAAEESAAQPFRVRGRHIKKRALRNKAISISFDEKDLKDFVTGFHKRKKKRRKEAEQKLQEAERRKRIEARKQRKLEREFALYGGAPPDSDAGPDEGIEEHEDDEESEPIASVSGTTMYDNGDMQVTVTTSEISREEDFPSECLHPVGPQPGGGLEQKRQKIPVTKKKQFKKVAKRKSHRKPHGKKDKRKGKKNGKH